MTCRSQATGRPAIVLIDGNNFYASCEAVMDPALLGRPLVVLSNNDGCIVSRSAEARALGIRMGQPYFQVRRELERQGVVVRSSNYALYADMSQRLMTTVEPWVEQLEIYSIDEAFGQLHRPAGHGDLHDWGRRLRHHVLCELGLPVAVGIAPSKVLAKLANRLAKTAPGSDGVWDFGGIGDPDPHLEAVAIEDVWGIGRQLSRWCRLRGINHARALRDMPSGELRRRCGVVGVRLQQELRGHACLPLDTLPAAKRETCVSRSFSQPITTQAELQEAIATYLSRAAEKLRRQRQRAAAITVFVRSSPFNGTSFYSNSATVTLPLASSDTAVLLQAALPLVEQLFKPHKPLQKAGVVLQNLQSAEILQHHLLVPLPLEQQHRRSALMATIDRLNHHYGSGTVQWAAAGLQTPWRMRRSQLSGAATTRLAAIPVVQAR
ncbi:Y-family DNA polymerase [Cyanobium sp. Aljojuca 7D2]|uniref:Y-family DNA polymerase n=1 Tax=Cyanobium sp. Aljojuca 7D2 TaxID=2823698 RepID=UPI0020CCC5BB|nr:Y-family DNA polymerase [Cyanobium sp. Aljojuca 7D2]MCP9889778.1 Y-family DNA polymerase [Cyanobium sp. Aljojuca 7D2]